MDRTVRSSDGSPFTFKPSDGRTLPCPERQDRAEFVERSTGLRLRVSGSGARAWSVSYWSASARTARRLKLGDASTMPLARARKLAATALLAVTQEGRDPFAEAKAQAGAERAARKDRAEARHRAAEERSKTRLTVGEVVRQYVQHRKTVPSGKHNRTARPNTLLNWECMIENHVEPVLAKVPVAAVTSEDFLAAMEASVTKGGPSIAPRIRELLCAAWRWLEQRPKTLGTKLPLVSPLVGLARDIGVPSRERERVLTPREIWHFWRAAESEGLAGEALRLSLLTAARVKEAADLPWSEVDLAEKTWTLPAARAKGGTSRVLPLSAEACTLLRRAQTQTGKNEFVFGPARVSEPAARIRMAMAGEPWQPRDLRRTAATIVARLGSDPFTVALVLGHANPDVRAPGVSAIYNRHDYLDRTRAALDRLGSWVGETVRAAREPGDVVSLKARGRA